MKSCLAILTLNHHLKNRNNEQNQRSDVKILLCADSHQAVNNVAEKLLSLIDKYYLDINSLTYVNKYMKIIKCIYKWNKIK